MASSLRRLDAFVKPREDLRSRSVVGGLITVVAATAASILFLSQVYLYLAGATRHSLHLAESISVTVPTLSQHSRGKIPIHVHVTFPHVKCRFLDVTLDSASLHDGKLIETQGNHAIELSVPTDADYKTALKLKKNAAVLAQDKQDACTAKGTLHVDKVGGTLSITISQKAWVEAATFAAFRMANPTDVGTKLYNVSHYVHDITFGDPFPLSHNPLKDASHMVENTAGGVFLANINVDLIPTRYQRFLFSQDTYQVSVTEHIVQPETLMPMGGVHLPGLAVLYDFSPLAVQHVEARDNFLVFVSSLVSIVGGVFVTVGLVTGCLLHSAAAVAKKRD